jgi:hypothetical protein
MKLRVEVVQGQARVNSVRLVTEAPDCKVLSLDFSERPSVLAFSGGVDNEAVYFEPESVGPDAVAPDGGLTTISVRGLPEGEDGRRWLVDAACSKTTAWIYCWRESPEAPVLWDANAADAGPSPLLVE